MAKLSHSAGAFILVLLAVLVACSPPAAPAATPTPAPESGRAAVVAFVVALRTLDRDAEAWWRDFEAYMQRAPSMQQTPMLSEFDGMNARYDALLERLKGVRPPAEPAAEAAYARWVTAFAKTQEFVRALREVAVTRQGDPEKLQALDAESTAAGAQASDAMQELITKHALKPEEITPPARGGR